MRAATQRDKIRHGVRRAGAREISLVSTAKMPHQIRQAECACIFTHLTLHSPNVYWVLTLVYTKPVADATYRLQPFRIGRIGLDLAAKAIDLDIDFSLAGRHFTPK